MMIFGEEKDWKELLHPGDQQVLADMLERTKVHKSAYLQAEDVKVAQLWSALLELKKDFDRMTETIKRVEAPFKTIVEIGEAEKRRTIQRIVTDIVKPTEEAEREATEKLVNSLMKF